MGCSKILFLALSSILFSLNLTSAQVRFTFCFKGANYTANSTYQANLNHLLASISNTTNQFYTHDIGRSPDRVYGLFQCRGDYNSQDCRRCAQVSSEYITAYCPYRKRAIIVYDDCWLHYSGAPFVSTLQVDQEIYSWNLDNVSDPRFAPTLGRLMDGLVVQAVSNASSLFAVNETNMTTSQKLYGLVQCTRDLSTSDCNQCLRKAVSAFPTCCDKKTGGRAVKSSCLARYETYQFFQLPLITAPAPTRGIIPPSTNNTTGQGKKSSHNIVAIVVPTIIGALVLSAIAIFCCLRRKKVFEIVNGKSDVESSRPHEEKTVFYSAFTNLLR